MRLLAASAAWVGGALLAAAAFAVPPVPPEQLAWAPGLEAAQKEAKDRKVPLLVVLNMDDERGNDAMVAEVYTAPAVRDAAKRCVVTIASIGRHAEVDDPRAGHKVCSRFGCVTCDQHRATEDVVRTEWLKKGPKDDVDSPRHIFRAPDGRMLFERVWTLDAAELVKLIDRAVAACAPESLAAWDTVPARLQRVSDPLRCIRLAALRDLLAAHDATVDAQLLELVRKCEDQDVARDVVALMAADMNPSRGEGLRKLLAAPSQVVRQQAAAAIAAERAKDSFDVLLAAFGHERNTETRCVLLRALAVAGGDPAKTRETVLKHAKTGEPPLRVHAIVALGPFAKEDAVVEALQKLPANEKLPDAVRAAACWTLGLSGRKDLVETLTPLTEERSEMLKRAAKAAIARIGGKVDPDYGYGRAWFAPLSVVLPDDGVR